MRSWSLSNLRDISESQRKESALAGEMSTQKINGSTPWNWDGEPQLKLNLRQGLYMLYLIPVKCETTTTVLCSYLEYRYWNLFRIKLTVQIIFLPFSLISSLSLSSLAFLNMLESILFRFSSRFFSLVKALNLSCSSLQCFGLLCSQSRSTFPRFRSLKQVALHSEWVDSLPVCTGIKTKRYM